MLKDYLKSIAFENIQGMDFEEAEHWLYFEAKPDYYDFGIDYEFAYQNFKEELEVILEAYYDYEVPLESRSPIAMVNIAWYFLIKDNPEVLKEALEEDIIK